MDKAKAQAPRQHAARKGALRLISGVQDGVALSDQAGAISRLAPPDRARAQRLALSVLRNIDRADSLLVQHVSKKPRPEVLDLLRLATVEMLEAGEAPHGAVNAAVGLVRGMGPKGRAAAGMVNAVLRKVSVQGEAWRDLPPEEMPDWLRGSVIAAWGEDVTAKIELAHQNGAPLDLTCKPGLDAPGDPLPTGSFRLRDAGQISNLPGYDSGEWWVQDAAAAMAARVLQPQPEENIVDLCAAPGGKTLQIAASGAHVTAVDISAARLTRLRENLQRCGLSADIVEADALEWQPDTAPHAILLDAPCSATGTIRRHPDLPLIRDGSAVSGLVELQARLIDRAVSMLRPGGRLVFATCSLLPEEGEAQLAAALSRHPELRVEMPDLPGIAPEWITAGGGLRLRPDYWPDLGGMDGFFIARLRKPEAEHRVAG
ncbi:RsmB/NOP family class I SAM-dependent RNA methyltransferase [Paracoccus aerodenitrificans]|uniref:RsmB/NOP family class I SAM-dependent RNA methyltransferase n=1 Tax=Paracoccus aerodenitrificans TaxID=3017781 RepID=UPI0022F074B5|nr:transcription antitermination factor NusB [Paracoccus aerodenitrificans]WBU64088.1 methyltransferase domain-containing protein [Paracoccus aerodenitrificans]